jgi:DNA-nicking Smr family endonuclease
VTRRKSRGLRPDEQVLWDQVKKNTIPLHRPAQKVLTEAVEQIAQTPDRIDIPMFRIGQKTDRPSLTKSAIRPDPIRMDSKNLDRLKKGKLVPEARLDLHGMTLAQAHPALIGFILKAHSNANRLVLVITGKGKIQTAAHLVPEQKGALKRQVPTWLSQAPVSSVIQHSTNAHSRHGGDGALYVYLRRMR